METRWRGAEDDGRGGLSTANGPGWPRCACHGALATFSRRRLSAAATCARVCVALCAVARLRPVTLARMNRDYNKLLCFYIVRQIQFRGAQIRPTPAMYPPDAKTKQTSSYNIPVQHYLPYHSLPGRQARVRSHHYKYLARAVPV